MRLSLRTRLGAAASLAFLAVCLYSCKHPVSQLAAVDDGGYPDAVNRILMLHCSSGPTGGGCHNASGADYANGLRTDSWDRLFDGGNHGAAVIPFDTVNSPLLHYINTDSTRGVIALPQMPYTGTSYTTTPLSQAEYNTIRDWIAAGAPDRNGTIPFSDNPDTRQKLYLTEQGSDVLSVVDAARHVIMRNIPIGMVAQIEAPHCVRVSKDGRFAYVAFQHGDWVQKIDTKTDKVVGSVKISDGDANWNILHVSDDGSKFIIGNFVSAHGQLDIINTATMEVETVVMSDIAYPHGMASTPGFDTIYVVPQNGNSVYKMYNWSTTPRYKVVSIDGRPANVSAGQRDPHEILFSPDCSRYFLTCQTSNELRVMNAAADTVMAAIPVPAFPQEMAVSRTKPYLFVSCMEGTSPTPGTTGAIVVINYETLQVVKTIWGPFWQPHAVSVDDAAGTFYVASTNQTGPAAGHNHDAGGRHGWMNVYDLTTLELRSAKNYETLVLPYSSDMRVK